MAQYQVGTLPRSVKTTPPGSFKGQIDGDAIQTFIYKLYIGFTLCMLDSTFARSEFSVTLLSGSAYAWYTTQYFAIGTGHASRPTWEHLKSDLWSYFKPPDYAY